MKYAKSYVAIIGAILMFFFIVPVADFVYITRFKNTEIVTSVSDDGVYSLTVCMIGEPDWPFGATHCHLDLRMGRFVIARHPISLGNDGARAREDNFSFYWAEDHVSVRVNASEQDDKIYQLHFDGAVERFDAPEDMASWMYGITVDDCWYDDTETEAVIAAIRDMPVKPTVRIVMSADMSASEYEELFSQIHEVAYIMACPVDSSEMHLYGDAQAYLDRFRDAFETLAPYTDVWEIGNEINGVAWIGQSPELVVEKVEAANTYIRCQGARTALTLYYPGPEDSQELFMWVDENLAESLARNMDYVLLSYYEDDHGGFVPAWSEVFPALEHAFPRASVGFGECGNTADSATESSKISMARSYYAMEPPSDHFVGGYFWWNWVQDCVPHEGNPVYDEINRAMVEVEP